MVYTLLFLVSLVCCMGHFALLWMYGDRDVRFYRFNVSTSQCGGGRVSMNNGLPHETLLNTALFSTVIRIISYIPAFHLSRSVAEILHIISHLH